ncbi:hypothetical protein K474DRAFT_1610279 [Panus rudis PR-1116 ss-1]|nr:hypothetical protein K474DRAFT_1610279 [Panus rudis PR-1116 ss-1]
MEWLYTGSSQKSAQEGDRLVYGVLNHPMFNVSQLSGFSVQREASKLDAALKEAPDAWKESTVSIQIPDGCQHRPGTTDQPVPVFQVPGLMHRPLVDVIRTAWTDPLKTRGFHYTPYRQFWLDPTGCTQNLHDELYTTDAFNQAHVELQSSPFEPDCALPRVICAIMLYSDSTHLASFGDAAAWPIYLFFGNQSKYIRVKPTSNACVHVAYMPKLPDAFHDWFLKETGHGVSADLLTHCRRELFHAIWAVLLDDEFLCAYHHGIVIDCTDGVRRRVYPRIFTYSADYPEKVLLACLRSLGARPCPRCTIMKAQIPEMGMKRDEQRRTRDARQVDTSYRARTQAAYRAVYELGKGVKSTVVEAALAEHSYTPTLNAFAVRLSEFNFNPFTMLAVDLLHEFELGVWKSVFTHLIRILVCIGGEAIQILNERSVPPASSNIISH